MNAILIGAIAVYAFARASVSSAVIVRDLLWFTVAGGLPSGRWSARWNSRLDHSEYWGSFKVARHVGRLLGLAAELDLP